MDFSEYFKTKNLTKRPQGEVHFEQKNTPDMVWCVAAVIVDLLKADEQALFADAQIRNSELYSGLMQSYFSKPPLREAPKEYDKLSRYQLNLLAYTGVLELVSERPMTYRVANRQALEYIAINDLNAAKFLSEYVDKFVKDNGLWESFAAYIERPTQQNYVHCKEQYWLWAKLNTQVKTDNHDHSFRVYNKIFNLLCYKHRVPGQLKSRVKDGVCPYSYLIYNRENFRDKDKPSGVTRQAYLKTTFNEVDNEGVIATLLANVKKSVARKHGNDSEIPDPRYGYHPHNGVNVHHIIPRSYDSRFALHRENLIALTPGQHHSYAHVQGNNHVIDPVYQAICLKVKLEHILQSLAAGDDFYDYSKFVDVVNACYDTAFASDVASSEIDSLLDTKIGDGQLTGRPTVIQ